jgi:hypothetical protein
MPDWNDSGPPNQAEIPAYNIINDKHAQGYVGNMKKYKRLRPYMNMVY